MLCPFLLNVCTFVCILDCTVIFGEGEITSPNYPSNYDAGTDICWEFTAEEGKVHQNTNYILNIYRFLH